MRVSMVGFGPASHVVFELVPFLLMAVAKGAGVGLHLVAEVADVVVEALPSGLSAHPD
jgi:hypothetical protein